MGYLMCGQYPSIAGPGNANIQLILGHFWHSAAQAEPYPPNSTSITNNIKLNYDGNIIFYLRVGRFAKWARGAGRRVYAGSGSAPDNRADFPSPHADIVLKSVCAHVCFCRTSGIFSRAPRNLVGLLNM